MASPNNPPSSAELTREYSHARYAQVNSNFGAGTERVVKGSVNDQILARQARKQEARKR